MIKPYCQAVKRPYCQGVKRSRSDGWVMMRGGTPSLTLASLFRMAISSHDLTRKVLLKPRWPWRITAARIIEMLSGVYACEDCDPKRQALSLCAHHKQSQKAARTLLK